MDFGDENKAGSFKMAVRLGVVLLTTLAFAITFLAYATDEITPKTLLNQFPICETTSSLGQRCKYNFKDIQSYSFLDVCCNESKNVITSENTVSIDRPNEWHYSFALTKRLFFIYEIVFVDRAINGGSYHTKSKYLALSLAGKIYLMETSIEKW